MAAGTIALIIVLIVVVLAVIGTAASIATRRRRLRDRFGPEYDRVAAELSSRRLAEAELTDRKHRVASYELRPLSDEACEKYSARWSQVQEQFVETPSEAVGEAQALIEAVMRERGYPATGYQQTLEDLSVEHAPVLEHYRAAHAACEKAAADGAGTSASTEELREAMISYRELFSQLLGRAPAAGQR